MVAWHHRLNGHEFEQVLGVGNGQGNLACCSPGSCKELDMTERLKNNKGCMVKIKTSLEDLNSLQIFVKSPNFSSHL